MNTDEAKTAPKHLVKPNQTTLLAV